MQCVSQNFGHVSKKSGHARLFRGSCLLYFLFLTGLMLWGQPRMFTHLDAFDGLSDNKIQHILQLPDGRMVFTTPKTINLYDGKRFRYFTSRPQDILPLPAYKGAYHVYSAEDNLLWVKDKQTLSCFDVRQECYISHLQELIQRLNGSKAPVVDLFLDSDRIVWLVRANGTIWNTKRKRLFKLPTGLGTLQDVDVADGEVYFFFDSGTVACFSLRNGSLQYIRTAYPAAERRLFDKMSLVVKAPDSCFYQLRNGSQAICLRFDPKMRRWKELLRTPYVLHTLIVPSKQEAYITCGKGLWKLELLSGKTTYKPSLQMAEGSSITTDINTVFEDREGGWWLGTSDKGLLYGHLWRDAFALDQASSKSLPLKTFRPLLINLSVEGKTVALQAGHEKALLPYAIPFVRHIELKSNQNTLSFDFSALNYALPMQTYYRYRLISGGDSAWHTVAFNSQSKSLDERGVLHLPFSRLAPGFYRLQVSAANHPDWQEAPVTEITFTIHAPWWLTPWAYFFYGCVVLIVIAVGFIIYKRLSGRRKKEQLLLERIKTLIERCNRYEAERTDMNRMEQEPEIPSPLNPQDNKFLQKAIDLVKQHLNTTYSVEELSRDLCMERTGLYKKLTVLLDQSPSLFIRNIRLQQAARLLQENKLSISDIAMETGFSSSSYFSRCFQEMYGCKPSEYAGKQEKST